jgi:hypothetical protein
MKRFLLSILIATACATAYAGNPRWKEVGTPIPAHANLDVRWETPTNEGAGFNVPTNAWPAKMWVYRLSRQDFSFNVISNLMALCSFTKTDKIKQDANEIVFKNFDGTRALAISFAKGTIRYDTPEPHYGPTNLAVGVPLMSEMPRLTKQFLQAVGIPLSEIQKTNGAPSFDFWQPFSEYYGKGGPITNIEYRAVFFRRSVDGAQVIGNAGGCSLRFGEHGRISQIHLTWPNLQPDKSSPTLAPQTIMQLLRRGKARQGLLPMGADDIDWPTVKSVTIKQAWPCYYAGNSAVLYPYLTLWTTVETPKGYVDVGIDTPIIDETGL